MGWFSGLFEGKIKVGKLVEDVTSGVDKLFLTNEEKIDYSKEQAANLAQFTKDTLSENTTRSKARRLIAILIIANAVLTFWFCIVLSLLGINPDFVLDIFLTVFGSTTVVMVLAFFFGGYYAKGITLNKKK